MGQAVTKGVPTNAPLLLTHHLMVDQFEGHR
jgi:hypothetical protein